jgi:hypothetical protein
MTKPVPRQQHKRSTLSNTWVRSAVQWTPDLMRALEACVRSDTPVKEAVKRLGVSDSSLARGAMLRLQQLLPPEDGHD